MVPVKMQMAFERVATEHGEGTKCRIQGGPAKG